MVTYPSIEKEPDLPANYVLIESQKILEEEKTYSMTVRDFLKNAKED